MLCIDSVGCLQNNTIKTNKYLAVYNNQTIKQTVMKQSDKKRSKDALTITKKDLCSMRTDNVTVTQRSDATIIEEKLDFSKLKKESESPDKRSKTFMIG